MYSPSAARRPGSRRPRRFSLLSDRDHAVMEDYQSLRQRIAELETHVERIEAAYQASQQQVAALSNPAGWRPR